MGLGENPVSFGYGGTAKAITNNQYNEFGEPYGPGEIVTCLLVSGWGQFGGRCG